MSSSLPSSLHLKKSPVILDTNVVLDCFIFNDAGSTQLREAIVAGKVQWIATSEMAAEFLRVTHYKNIESRIALLPVDVQNGLLTLFSRYAVKAKAPEQSCAAKCRDADDQMFIDLAAAHNGILISKDREVLKLNRKLGLVIEQPSKIKAYLTDGDSVASEAG